MLLIGIDAFLLLQSPAAKFGASSGPDHYNTEYFHNGLLADSTQVPVGVNELIQAISGFSGTLSTSTTLSAGQFCGTTNQRWVSGLTSGATMTSTLPTAMAAYAVCGSLAGFGAYNGNIVTNDSTSTLSIVAGTGMTFKCPTTNFSTTTIVTGCTSSQITVLASTTVIATGYWDSSSSTMRIMWSEPAY